MKLRYFNTPLTSSSYIKEPQVELCWGKKCGKAGDHSHIFWDCRVIESFWECVKEKIDTILKVNIALDQAWAYFLILGQVCMN